MMQTLNTLVSVIYSFLFPVHWTPSPLLQAQKLSRNLEPVSIYENKSRKNGAGEKSKREGQGQRGNGEGERAREVTQILFKADQEDTKCQPKKKVCNRDINSQRNIIFIYEYCQHAEVYKLWHKTVF